MNPTFSEVLSGAWRAIMRNKTAVLGASFISAILSQLVIILFETMGVTPQILLQNSGISIISSLISMIVAVPITFGCYFIAVKSLQDEDATIGDAIAFYINGKKLKVSILANLYYLGLVLIISFATVIPAMLVMLILPSIGVIAIYVAFFISMVWSLVRIPALVLLACDPSGYSIREAFGEAKKITSHKKSRVILPLLVVTPINLFATYILGTFNSPVLYTVASIVVSTFTSALICCTFASCTYKLCGSKPLIKENKKDYE